MAKQPNTLGLQDLSGSTVGLDQKTKDIIAQDPEKFNEFAEQQRLLQTSLGALYSKYGGLEQEFQDFGEAQQAALGDLRREASRATALRSRRGGSLAGLRGSALETGRKVGVMREEQEATRGAKRQEMLDIAADTTAEIKGIREQQANRQAKVNDALSRAAEIINSELGSVYSTPGQRRAARDRIMQEILVTETDPLVINAIQKKINSMMQDTAGRIDF